MADNGPDLEDFNFNFQRYDADHSDLGEYEDVSDVIARAKQRIRAQRAKQRADIQKALQEDQRRKMAREAEHQARLKKIEQYRRHVRKRIAVPPRILKQVDVDTTLPRSPSSPSAQDQSPALSPTPPSKPAPQRMRRAGPRTRRMQMRAKRQAEAPSRRLQSNVEHQAAAAFMTEDQNGSEEQRHVEAQSSEIDSGAEAQTDGSSRVPDVILRAKVRVARRKQEERRQKLLQEEQQQNMIEEVRQRNVIAQQVGRRQARQRLEARREQMQLEAERRAAWVEEQMQKKQEKANAEAIMLPKMRSEAAKRGKEWLLQERKLKEQLALEKLAQQKAILETKQQYKSPRLIAKLKKAHGGQHSKSQAAVEEEATCKVAVGEARGTVSTEYCLTENLQVQQHKDPEMMEHAKLVEIDRGQAVVADEAARKAVGEAVASVAADFCAATEPQNLKGDAAEDTDQIAEDLHVRISDAVSSASLEELQVALKDMPPDILRRIKTSVATAANGTLPPVRADHEAGRYACRQAYESVSVVVEDQGARRDLDLEPSREAEQESAIHNGPYYAEVTVCIGDENQHQ